MSTGSSVHQRPAEAIVFIVEKNIVVVGQEKIEEAMESTRSVMEQKEKGQTEEEEGRRRGI